MSTILTVPANEHGRLRIFNFSPKQGEMDFLKPQDVIDGAAIAQLLACEPLDGSHIDLFRISDLDDMPLSGFLAQGAGVAETVLAPERASLDALEGAVLILYSGAFSGRATTLVPVDRMTPVTVLREDQAEINFQPLDSKSAQGQITAPSQPTSHTRSHPHLTLLMALLALPVVVLIIGSILWGILK